MLDGDSVTAGQPDPSFAWHIPYTASVNANLTGVGSAPITFANVAVGGNTTADCLAGVANVTAQTPDHVSCMIGINDHFNHGGTPIPPATSAANVAAYIAAVKAVRPTCRFHFISGLWYLTENWPDGVGSDDAAVNATLNAIKATVQATANCEWLDIRTPIYTIDAPLLNPGHAANGIMTQVDGTHPSKPAGQVVISHRVWNLTTLGV